MRIIDSHVHFWDLDQLDYPWLAGIPQLNRSILPVDYEQAVADWQLDGLIFVQGDCLHEQSLAEVSWVSGLDAPALGMVAFAPLELGEAARSYLDQLQQRPILKGVRRLIQPEEPGFAVQSNFIRGVQLLEEYDLPFDICITHDQLPDTIELVRQCPDVRFVLDHIGKPGIADGRIKTWRENIRILAGFDHVWCKLSGVITEADWQSWSADTLRPYLGHILEQFGVDRLMFGSDWPVVNLAGTYSAWMEALLSALSGLSDTEKQNIFYKNCLAFYRVSLDD
jgi:L-fuconolactonase